MFKKFILCSVLFTILSFVPLAAQELAGFLNLNLGESSLAANIKLTEAGWQKEEMFKNIIEYKKEDAAIYGIPISCIDLKFNHDKLAMMTIYFNLKEDAEEADFSTIKDKAVFENGYVFNTESGSLKDKNYRSTYLKRRKMLVINNVTMTDLNLQVSISDIDLLLN